MIDVERFKQILLTREAELENRLDDIEHELDEEPSKDFEERAVEREGDEVLEGLGGAGLIELRQVKAALGRVAAGTFGVCVNCGEEISVERLEASPHAARCRRCF